MDRRRLLVLAATGFTTAVAGCSGQSPAGTPTRSPSPSPSESPTPAPSESECGPGDTAIGDIERTGPYVTIAGTVESTAGSPGILRISDSTGRATVTFQEEYQDSVRELSEGDCVSDVHGKVTSIDPEGKVTLENARLD